jgi:prepilin-type N-terminal cleavage/methylation domain-containing protein
MNRRRRAFSLIELLIVISIIGILVTLVTAAVRPIQSKSRDAKRKADVNSFLSGATLFQSDFKIYPNPTFYLGEPGTEGNGGVNSNFGIASEVVACNQFGDNGKTSLFMDLNGETIITPGNPTVAELDSKLITLKPGFKSVNHFLYCLKYLSHVFVDPNQDLSEPYHYRVSYDYSEILVSAKLENSVENTRLLPSSTEERYYEGNGKTVRHLDDNSDVNFGGSAADGFYLYQCHLNGLGASIPADDRAGYPPFVVSGSIWVANTGTTADVCNSSQPNGRKDSR